MEFLRQMWVGLLDGWRRLSSSARVNIVVTALVTAVVIAGVVVLGSQPQYVELYSQLSGEDASAIQTYLGEQGIPYKAQDSGKTIAAPVERISDIRVALSARNIPSSYSTKGFELLDKQDIMVNKYQQDINYQRAVRGELERMLNDFKFVAKSRVFISQAKEELFTKEQKPSKAAVTLRLKRPVTKQEVRAILGIISTHGGTNLDINHITLFAEDASGTTTFLHEPPRDDFASIANSKLDFIHELETQREDRVHQVFVTLGRNSVVRVSAKVDFNSMKETKREVIKGVPISTQSTTTSTTTRELPPEGPAGATANPPDGMVTARRTITEDSQETTTENLDPTVTTTERTFAPGDVKGYTVSAFVEGDYKAAAEAAGKEAGKKEYVPLSDEQKTMFKEMIAKAVGVDVKPDDVSVYDQPFQIENLQGEASPTAAASPGTGQEQLIQYGTNIGKVLLVIVGFLLVRRFLRGAMVTPELQEDAFVARPDISPEETRKREIAAEVARASQQEPQTVAGLLRTWMNEPEE